MVENHKAKEDGSGKDDIMLAFDFVYLPIDFKSGLNKGYAFVNFTSPKGAWKFNMTASNMKWDMFQSHKIRKVVAARLQGKEALQRHFESMHFPCESEEVLPICFNPPRDGLTNWSGKERTIGRLGLFNPRQV
ncbi:putative mei2-like protein [Lupinus albus]|uniref:Putative mei2-like protein n=1 Tax=Lupinus albus TaxID=3870 RepID=A0A6A4QSD6_LUPAL|nr:putative mei2-like protein [Lupinus albus]